MALHLVGEDSPLRAYLTPWQKELERRLLASGHQTLVATIIPIAVAYQMAKQKIDSANKAGDSETIFVNTRICDNLARVWEQTKRIHAQTPGHETCFARPDTPDGPWWAPQQRSWWANV